MKEELLKVDSKVFVMSLISVMVLPLFIRCLLGIRVPLPESVCHVPGFLDAGFRVNFDDIQFPGISFICFYDMASLRTANFILT